MIEAASEKPLPTAGSITVFVAIRGLLASMTESPALAQALRTHRRECISHRSNRGACVEPKGE